MEFAEHWLEILTAVYLGGMILYGHYKGFIRLAVSVAALILALLAVHVAMPYVTDWLKEKTPAYEMIKNGMVKAVGLDDEAGFDGDGAPDGGVGLDGDTARPDLGETGKLPEGAGPGAENGGLSSGGLPALQRKMIEEMKLPEPMKKLLIDNNNGEVYRELGVSLFRDYVVEYLANIVIRIVAFFLLLGISYVLIHILVVWLDLVARLPILSGMNKIAGAILGGAEALLFIWMACLILTALSGTEFGILVLNQIEKSPWLSYLYHNNMLGTIVMGVVASVL